MHAAATISDHLSPDPPIPSSGRADGEGRAIRVLVADDSDLYRAGLVRAIRASADLELVADVRGGTSAIAAARLLRPDAVLIDYRMPDLDGWSAAVVLHAEQPDLRIVLMSAHGEELADRLARGPGPFDPGTCDAVVDKAASRRELLDRIRSLVRPPASV